MVLELQRNVTLLVSLVKRECMEHLNQYPLTSKSSSSYNFLKVELVAEVVLNLMHAPRFV